MKCLVEVDTRIDLTLAAVGGVIVGLTRASLGVTYLIAFAVLAVGTLIAVGLDRVRLWRETHHGPKGRR